MIEEVNRNPTPRDLRGFAASMLFGFGVIGGLLWWASSRGDAGRGWRSDGAQWLAVALWSVGLLTAATALGAPALGKKVYVNWMLAAAAMGRVTMPVLFTLMFIIILPIFTLIRFKDPLRKRMGAEDGYWEKHKPHEATIERMQHPF